MSQGADSAAQDDPVPDGGVYKEVVVPISMPGLSRRLLMTPGFVAWTFSLDNGIRSLCCPDCEVALNLLQPEEEDPSRLLGTCGICSKWFVLMELQPDWKNAVLVEIPTTEILCPMLEGLETSS
jgi:hypothetical protein